MSVTPLSRVSCTLMLDHESVTDMERNKQIVRKCKEVVSERSPARHVTSRARPPTSAEIASRQKALTKIHPVVRRILRAPFLGDVHFPEAVADCCHTGAHGGVATALICSGSRSVRYQKTYE